MASHPRTPNKKGRYFGIICISFAVLASDGLSFIIIPSWHFSYLCFFIQLEIAWEPAGEFLFDIIPTTILDTTPVITPPTIQTDTTDSDTPDTPPSPTHDTSFTETTLSTQRSPTTSGALRRQVMVLAPGQPIPHGRPYRYHLNGPARADLLPSPKRIRSPETATDLKDCLKDSFEPYVPREVGLGVDFEDESFEPSRSRGADLEMDVDVVRSDMIEIDLEIQVEIDECFAYADALRDRGIDARVVVEATDREESETDTRGPVEVRVERVTHPVMPKDTPKPAQEGAVEVIEGAQREQGHMIIGAETAVTVLTKRVAELERDNRRRRGIVSVESQRVDRL
ncbi:hypothetical protein Tco_0904030 [Tanacetum coccineum]